MKAAMSAKTRRSEPKPKPKLRRTGGRKTTAVKKPTGKKPTVNRRRSVDIATDDASKVGGNHKQSSSLSPSEEDFAARLFRKHNNAGVLERWSSERRKAGDTSVFSDDHPLRFAGGRYNDDTKPIRLSSADSARIGGIVDAIDNYVRDYERRRSDAGIGNSLAGGGERRNGDDPRGAGAGWFGVSDALSRFGNYFTAAPAAASTAANSAISSAYNSATNRFLNALSPEAYKWTAASVPFGPTSAPFSLPGMSIGTAANPMSAVPGLAAGLAAKAASPWYSAAASYIGNAVSGVVSPVVSFLTSTTGIGLTALLAATAIWYLRRTPPSDELKTGSLKRRLAGLAKFVDDLRDAILTDPALAALQKPKEYVIATTNDLARIGAKLTDPNLTDDMEPPNAVKILAELKAYDDVGKSIEAELTGVVAANPTSYPAGQQQQTPWSVSVDQSPPWSLPSTKSTPSLQVQTPWSLPNQPQQQTPWSLPNRPQQTSWSLPPKISMPVPSAPAEWSLSQPAYPVNQPPWSLPAPKSMPVASAPSEWLSGRSTYSDQQPWSLPSSGNLSYESANRYQEPPADESFSSYIDRAYAAESPLRRPAAYSPYDLPNRY